MADKFERLLKKRKRIGRLDKQKEFLKWREDAEGVDSQPEDYSGEELGHDIAEVVDERYSELTGEEMKELLSDIDPENFEDDEEGFSSEEKKAIYREVEREFEKATAVNPELEKKIERKEAELDSKWSDSESFDEVSEDLQELVELKRDFAEEVGYSDEPYEVFFKSFEPYMDFSEAADVLERLKKDLPELVEKIDFTDFNVKDFEDFLSHQEVDSDSLMDFHKNLLFSIGLDPEKTNVGKADHGMEGGHRYSTPTLLDLDKSIPAAVKTTLHEGGHQAYRQGLGSDGDESYLFTPLGETLSHLVDESLARFWENHVGRSREFAEYIAQDIQEHFELEDSLDDIADSFYAWMNGSPEENFNRLEADEVTYHLHVLTRYDIERDLINGNIDVDDVPAEWEGRMEDYLGEAPSDVSGKEEGIMQDPHWFRGKFGYFPQYTLGTIVSAQIYESVEEELDEEFEEYVREGEFDEISDLLDEKVHRHGKRYPTDELIERATGDELDPDALIRYFEDKFA